jgi:hypothetical protein
MECNAVSILYMLQSHGLIPARMTLEEFQEAFTTVDITKNWHLDKDGNSTNDPRNIDPLASTRLKQVDDIQVGGTLLREKAEPPIRGVDMFSQLIGGNRPPDMQRPSPT